MGPKKGKKGKGNKDEDWGDESEKLMEEKMKKLMTANNDISEPLGAIPTPLMPTDEQALRLIQDDDLIAKIHTEELPPDEYYDALGPALQKKFPGADPALVEHVVALTAAFDAATSFALSFGIAKFQLGQPKVKLVGEHVGREGRMPNPELVEAIRKWPPINELKPLQSFLGTTNYARPHMGPAYARIAHPLRPLLKKDAAWPMNAEQLKAVE